jgi:hypothetical protein
MKATLIDQTAKPGKPRKKTKGVKKRKYFEWDNGGG